MILLDNNPASYSFSKSNGFPISTWIGKEDDRELIQIIPVLNYLSNVSDVRSYITHMNENNDFSLTRASELIDEGNKDNNNNINTNINTNDQQITNLKHLIETPNANTEREGKDSSLSNRNDKKYNINVVNNNYLQVYINSINSPKDISTSPMKNNNNNITASSSTFAKFATQFGLNSTKLGKLLTQYKTISASKNERIENDEIETEGKRLVIFNQKNYNAASNRILNPIIGKRTNQSPKFIIKSKRPLEIDSFRSSSTSIKMNNINLGHSNSKSSLIKNIQFIPSSYQITPMALAMPMMNQTNNFKPKIIKYNNNNNMNDFRKTGFLDDPFLKQGWSTTRSMPLVFKSKSCSKFNVPSSTSHKLKYGIL